MLGSRGAAQIQAMLDAARTTDAGVIASTLTGATLLWGALSLVGQFQNTINSLWNVEPDPEQGGNKNLPY